MGGGVRSALVGFGAGLLGAVVGMSLLGATPPGADKRGHLTVRRLEVEDEHGRVVAQLGSEGGITGLKLKRPGSEDCLFSVGLDDRGPVLIMANPKSGQSSFEVMASALSTVASFSDHKGKPVLSLGYAEGSPNIVFTDGNRKPRLSLGVSAAGPGVLLQGPNGKVTATLLPTSQPPIDRP